MSLVISSFQIPTLSFLLQLTTKIWPSHYDDVAKALETSLANFGFDYVDRMILILSTFHSQKRLTFIAQSIFSTGRLR